MNNHINEDKAVGQLAEIIALQYGIKPKVAKQIRIVAALHDIGKQKIAPDILNKPGKLNPDEFEVLKTHTVLGAEMLSDLQGELGIMARECCLNHHEWYNGGGYWGRYTDDLPYYIPFVAISDVFTALVNPRPYKPAWTLNKAVDYIKQQAGTQFSPELVEIFVLLIKKTTHLRLL